MNQSTMVGATSGGKRMMNMHPHSIMHLFDDNEQLGWIVGIGLALIAAFALGIVFGL